MKIKLDKVREKGELTVEVRGDESWLAEIYSNLQPESLVEGEIKVSTTLIENRYKVEGAIRIKTKLNCRRCLKDVDWNKEEKFELHFIDEKETLYKERDLKGSELDEYYPEELGTLDLEIILNDMVQESIPLSISKGDIDHECIDTSEKDQDNYSVKICSAGQNVSAMQKAFEMMKKK